jgi:hypothetical protein
MLNSDLFRTLRDLAIDADALEQLLPLLGELGLGFEQNPMLALELAEGIGEPRRERLREVAQHARVEGVATLASALQDLGDGAALTSPALLADDPQFAEDQQSLAVHVLQLRESIHRLQLAGLVLGAEDLQSEQADLERLDERLLALVPRMTSLTALRSLAASRVPAGFVADHWWWTRPAVAEDGDDDTGLDQAAQQLGEWLADRLVPAEDGPVLHLSEAESRALLSTPRGRRLAAELDGRIVFGLLRADEASDGHSAEPTNVIALPLRLRGALDGNLRLAAATPGELTVYVGLAAVVGAIDERAPAVVWQAAECITGLGVVAHGLLQSARGEQTVWLLVPGREVREVHLGAQQWRAADWQPGGLALVPADDSSDCTIAAVRDDGETLHLRLYAGPPAGSALLQVLLALVFEQDAEAERHFAALAPDPDFSGLRLALDAYRRDQE